MIVSRVRGTALGVICAATLLVGSGCGLGVSIQSPSQAIGGASVPFTLGLTNNTQCPIGQPIGIFLPFLPASEFEATGVPEIDEIFLALLNTACTGEPVQLPDGITCSIVEEQLVCEETDPPLSTGPVPSGDVPVRVGDNVVANCHREGSKISCKFVQQLQDASVFATQPLLCIPLFEGLAVCGSSTLDPGDTATGTFFLNAPTAPGVYRSLFFGLADDTGVCDGGTGNGQACGEDSDCGGGTCAPGICINDMTQARADGCTTTGDCAMGESCVTCQPSLDPPVTLPIACAQIVISQQAPAQSPWGMATAALALLGLGWFGLRRMKRANG